MTLNLVDICLVKYPGQIEEGNITFKQDSNGNMSFVHWDVQGIPMPDAQQLISEASQWERPYQIKQAYDLYSQYIQLTMDATARSKSYGDAVACASYISSGNAKWASEAATFIAWRDSCWSYAYGILNAVDQGAPIPSFEDFKNGLPTITWPEE